MKTNESTVPDTKKPLAGKRLSILGDSISTYIGISNDTSANSTLFYNPFHYYEPFPLEKTYWMRLIDSLGLSLCVNNSWSGGNLSGVDDPDSGVNRVNELSRDDGTDPDIIIVFMGINDFGRRVDPSVFSKDYKKTLSVIKEKYPLAYVCCVNLPDRHISIKADTEVFNGIIADSVSEAGERFFVADFFGSEMNNENYFNNTTDRLHPDEDGMKIIADFIEKAILSAVG